MSAGDEVYVPDLESVWLGVACENYATADLALWKAKTAMGDDPSPAGIGHLDQLMARRRAAYDDLIGWTQLAEASRVRAEREANK